MHNDQAQNYDPEINKEYIIDDTPFPLPHHLWQLSDLRVMLKKTPNFALFDPLLWKLGEGCAKSLDQLLKI